jgi:D-alanyl-D-alanine carboxypeptidase
MNTVTLQVDCVEDRDVHRAVVELGDVVWQDAVAAPAPWWSLSKTAIAAAALVLVQRGRLTLNSPLPGQDYTLRQLLQHTAGLPDYGSLAQYQQAVALGQSPWSRQELFDRVEARRLRSVPGKRFAYSNVGYLIVRTLIEDVTGTDLSEALEALVFHPLGLDGVRVASAPSDQSGYPLTIPIGYHPGWVFHGLVCGTPARAALFLNRLLGGSLLNPALLSAMQEPFMISQSSIPNRPWNSLGYGLGLMIDMRSPVGSCYGHTGEGPGSTTATYLFAELPRGRTVAVFAGIEDQSKVECQLLALARGNQIA